MSHDRAFLDNVVTEVIAFEGSGVLREYVGGYSEWADYQARSEAARKNANAPGAAAGPQGARAGSDAIAPAKSAAKKSPAQSPARNASRTGPGRLAFGEERELSALPMRIETLEARVEEIRRRFADPALYRDAAQEAKALQAELAQVERDLADAYARWEVLEGRKGATGNVDE